MANRLTWAVLLAPLGIAIVVGLFLLTVRAGGAAEPEVGLTAAAELVSPSGDAIGTVEFRQAATGVLVMADLKGIAPGGHAFIIHEFGSCSPDFDAAGDHFNPEETDHGFVHSNWEGNGSAGAHGGDLPNIYAAADGSARADFFTQGIILNSGPRHSVFDDDGSAIIVHERPDAYGEEESDTGARIACGIIRRT
ncbi:MAG: superoxide dismutase family protein [Chloroflexota bacterium]|nr:superoxide dismutase family protein [Chloroflexota bacterium]